MSQPTGPATGGSTGQPPNRAATGSGAPGAAATCRAVAVRPGVAGSAELRQVPVGAPAAGQLLLRVIRVGICGTDGEIEAGLYGQAPPGEDHLVLGHESLVRVAAVGPDTPGWSAGQLAVAIVRRPCPERCPPCAAGRWDMCLTGNYSERGIARLHGFLREALVEDASFVVPVDESLEATAVLVEPLSIVEKAISEAFRMQERLAWQPRRALVTGAGPVGLLAALQLLGRGLDVWVADQRPAGSPKASICREAGATYIDDSGTSLENAVGDLRFDLAIEATGYSPLVFRAMNLLARNGVLALTGVTGGHREVSVDANMLNSSMVLENHVVFGSVNAAREHYEHAVADLAAWHQRWGALPERLITARHPLDSFRDALQKSPDDIKTVVEVSGGAGSA